MLRRIALVAFTLLTLAGCGSDDEAGLQTVRDDDRSMFFQVPSDWTVLHEGDLTGLVDTPFVSQAILDLPVVSRVVFEGGTAGELVTAAL